MNRKHFLTNLAALPFACIPKTLETLEPEALVIKKDVTIKGALRVECEPEKVALLVKHSLPYPPPPLRSIKLDTLEGDDGPLLSIDKDEKRLVEFG